MESRDNDALQKVTSCGCLGTLILFGLALTTALVFWSAKMIGTMP